MPGLSTTGASLKPVALQRAGLVIALLLFAVPWVVDFSGSGLSPAGHRTLSIFLMAVVLWVSEAIPLHATAALIILLEILLISDKSLVPISGGFDPPAYAMFFHSLANPVLILFLGGFFLADGAAKYNLDRNLASVLLKPFGQSPRMILLGLMAITAFFSMFMSNTATSATMLAVAWPVVATLPKGDRMRGAMILCIPVAANIGGMGTPIGTPPNAIALAALSDQGIYIGFLMWMLMTMPFVIVLLLLAWWLLILRSPTATKQMELNIDAQFVKSPHAVIFYATFILTIILWLTEQYHGLSSSIVGFIPVVIMLATGVFSAKDFQSVQWHVLWLVAGGIALGKAVGATGIDHWLIGLISWEHLTPIKLAGVSALIAMAVATVISRSATANLLIPIGASLASSGMVAADPIVTCLFLAIGASLAMALPISTPPNAMAYSTGEVRASDMAFVGLITGIVGWSLFVMVAMPFWRFLGVIK